jgi:anti-sigma factor RsiW
MSRPSDEQINDYLMGELPVHERERMLEMMSEDPALRERVTSLESVTGMLESLPHEAWQTLGERPAPHTPRTAPRMRIGLVAAVCVLLLGIGIGVGVLIERPGATTGAIVVLHPLSGPSSEQATARMTSGGRMVLTVDHLPSTAPGRFYELWLMNSTSDLVAVASFRVGSDGRAQLNVPLPVSAARYRYLDISLQQAAAGPAHSGDSVLRAAIPS